MSHVSLSVGATQASDFAPRQAAVEYSQVTFSYSVERPPAVENVTLRVEEGERLGILGPNGGGTSTLCRTGRRDTSIAPMFHVKQPGDVRRESPGMFHVKHTGSAAMDGRISLDRLTPPAHSTGSLHRLTRPAHSTGDRRPRPHG